LEESTTALTTSSLNLKHAFLGTAVLEGIHERGLDGKEGPVAIGRGAGRLDGGIDDGLVAAPNGRAVDGKVQGRHCRPKFCKRDGGCSRERKEGRQRGSRAKNENQKLSSWVKAGKAAEI